MEAFIKLIIAGSRDLDIKYPLSVTDFIRYFIGYITITEVVSGGAKGIDSLGEMYANYNTIPIKRFDADWYGQGRKAGPLRNQKMAKYADALLLIWRGDSPGSANMKEEMLKLGKPVYEVVLKEYNGKDKTK